MAQYKQCGALRTIQKIRQPITHSIALKHLLKEEANDKRRQMTRGNQRKRKTVGTRKNHCY
jgi:hypothetical protein